MVGEREKATSSWYRGINVSLDLSYKFTLDVGLADGWEAKHEEQVSMVLLFTEVRTRRWASWHRGWDKNFILDMLHLKCMLECGKEINVMCEILRSGWKWRDTIGDIRSDESRWDHLAIQYNIEKKWKYDSVEIKEKRIQKKIPLRRSIHSDALTLNKEMDGLFFIYPESHLRRTLLYEKLCPRL